VSTWAVVVGAGSGTRFGGPKQFAELAGRRLVDWSLDVARQACDGVVLVLPEAAPGWEADRVVAGGPTRSESVRRGLEGVPGDARIIAVHDAARPLAGLGLWVSVIAAIEGGADAAIPAVPVTDTVKEIGEDGRLVTLDRSRLVAVQTPQAFRAGALKDAHAGGADATDDAALVEAAGGKVVLVEGSPHNIKITSPFDLLLAATLIGSGS
jgi:2-C-methyl-D-erythritol 4-phosphate cytidylyltransferase